MSGAPAFAKGESVITTIGAAVIVLVVVSIILQWWFLMAAFGVLGFFAGSLIVWRYHKWHLKKLQGEQEGLRRLYAQQGAQPIYQQPRQRQVDGGTHSHVHLHGVSDEQLARVLGRGQ